jgi:CO/xanthine dehydrogenase Mo-binding subunit
VSSTTLPNNLKQHPNLRQWLRLTNAQAEIFPGKVEIGQGIVTALVQIASEELGLHPEQIHAVPASTALSPNEAVTSGSLSIQECGFAIRLVCALARATLMDYAQDRMVELARPKLETLKMVRGRLVLPSGEVLCTYWDEAIAPKISALCFERLSPAQILTITEVRAPPLAPPSLARLDLPAKLRGEAAFIQDMRLPELRFSLVVRGVARTEQLAFLRKSLENLSNHPNQERTPELLLDGAFAALTCSTLSELARYQRMLDQVITKYTLTNQNRPQRDTSRPDWLTTTPRESTVVFKKSWLVEHVQGQAAVDSKKERLKVFDISFDKPWLSHASIGLSCAIALYRPGESLNIWTHSQGIFNLRSDLFLALGERAALSEAQFIVQHAEGAGCYGHNGADDVAFDATRIALSSPNTPVRVQWTRAQELTCAPFSPAMRVKICATLSNADSPKVASWQHTLWSNGHSLRPGRAATPTLLGSSELEHGTPERVSFNATSAMGYGAERNAQPLYEFNEVLVESHRLTEMPIRSSAFRGLGAIANVFATESMMEHLARHLNEDSLNFRLKHLSGSDHDRARQVLLRVAQISSWPALSQGDSANEHSMGYGLAFARYKNTGAWCAVVAMIELSEKVQVRKLWIAADVGRVVNEDGVRNQLEGAAIQSTSIALVENAYFAGDPGVSPSWEDYPILRFGDIPEIEIALLNRPDQPSLGAGEPATAPVVAAIANAVSNAIGTTIRTLPLTPETIAQAIQLN